MCGHKPVWSLRVQIQYGREYGFLCLCKRIKEFCEIFGSILRVLGTETIEPDLMMKTQPYQIDKGICIWTIRI